MPSTEFANSLTTSETLMFPTSLTLNQRFSYLKQVLRSSDEEKEKINGHENKLTTFGLKSFPQLNFA